jgi:DNA-directed RNA polymerase specialized sigma24 family protein
LNLPALLFILSATTLAGPLFDGEEFDLLNQVLDDRAAHNPEQQLLRRELSARILRALERLKPRAVGKVHETAELFDEAAL